MIINDLGYLTEISLEVSVYKVGGQKFSSSANALAIAQTRTGGFPVKEEYSLVLTAVTTGAGYSSSRSISEAAIIPLMSLSEN